MVGLTDVAPQPTSAPRDEPSEVDDAALVARAQRDPRAFGALYARYLGPIYGYCLRRLADREAAEDATSQTFLKALDALPRYRDGSVRAWLFAIAHNVVVDAHRRRRPWLALERAAPLVDAAPSPEERAADADAERRVRTLLGRLTEDQRRVVELRLAGLTGPEIAHVLGRRPEAVKSTQFRAYARLRRLMDERAGVDGGW